MECLYFQSADRLAQKRTWVFKEGTAGIKIRTSPSFGTHYPTAAFTKGHSARTIPPVGRVFFSFYRRPYLIGVERFRKYCSWISRGRSSRSSQDASPLRRDIIWRTSNRPIQARRGKEEASSSMAPRLPAQQLLLSPDKKLVVVALGSDLLLVDRASGTRLCSTRDAGLNPVDANHTGLIRLLLIHQDSSDPLKPTILFSTGEDKLLKTWRLPDLKLLHSSLAHHRLFFLVRQLIKRATSIAVSPDGKNIVIADKFGDVYDLPFDAPSQTVFQSDPDQEAPKAPTNAPTQGKDGKATVEGDESKTVLKALAPIAGHVSVLTSLTIIPSGSSGLLVTADRDEHIRISRYPQGWSIVSYLLGHRKFVGALLWLPSPTDPHSGHGRLLSGGGDDSLFVWDHLRGLATQKIDISRLANGMKVWPAKQAWFSKSRTNKRRRPNPSEPQTQPAECESTENNKTLVVKNEEAAAAQDVPTDTAIERQPIIQKTCVNKIIYTPPSEVAGSGYVLVTSVGSSTIAYVPLPGIFDDQQPATADHPTRYIDLNLPVLDIAVFKDTSVAAAFANNPPPPPNPRAGSGGRSGKKQQGRLVSQARCEHVLAQAATS
ncbi:uncharacterized protein VP01_337g13 [Puccinia sorghi]|uniref:Uncharacterized protein n=1 Tax=Puccinia sorghi TaxID=27349 RepID=A0A0L6UWR5_9BASI|nr:uncharacterized protein VP01_337g13 [Puccinia sorghi]